MLDLAYTLPKPKVISGAKHDWELVIGMEIHAQVASNAKLFSGASTAVGSEPNSNVAFVDAAMPGMLPVINEFCVEQAVRTGLGLKAQINLNSAFDRKNYFYPDLPQGYQISQLYHPIVGEGEVLIETAPGVARMVRIERIHLEQDAGKSIHDMDPTMSFVDFNRTGVALMEIVSRPDIRGPEEAAAFITKLRQILRYLGTCDGNMQNGNMRADVNVSVCRPGQYEKYQAKQDFSHLGTRCELKNMNSMRFIQLAIDYEARRQIAILEDGGSITQETRLYDPDKNETRSMRSKEEAHDYRYFPDPDLLPLEIEQAWVDEVEATLPEMPDNKKLRFVNKLGLTEYTAGVLTQDRETADAFEAECKILWFKRYSRSAVLACMSDKTNWPMEMEVEITEALQLHARDPEIILSQLLADTESIANIVAGQVFAAAKMTGETIDKVIERIDIAGVVFLITTEVISSKMGKELFDILLHHGGDAIEVAETNDMKQVTDTGAIEAQVDAIIAANPDQVEKAKANPKLAGWFVGQVIKASGGKANPATVNDLVAKKLGL